MSQTIEVKVPDIGDFKDVPVIEVMVKPGDMVNAEDSLITLESDKATIDVPSPAAGKVKEIKVKIGDKLAEGSVVLLLETADAKAAPAPASKPATPAAPAKPAPAAQVTKAAPVPAPAATATSGKSEIIEVKVPDIGDFKDVPVIEVLVKVGDKVSAEDSLITLESEKATIDVPSPATGTVKEVKVKVGDKVGEGSVVLVLDAVAAPAPTQASRPDIAPPVKPNAPTPKTPAAVMAATVDSLAAPAAEEPTTPPPVIPRPAPQQLVAEIVGGSRSHASPSVRRFARELGVDVARVRGTGPKNRILKEDVQAFVKAVMTGAMQAGAAPSGGLNVAPWPKVDFAKFGPVEAKPLSRIKKLSGANLSRNWVMIPHVTQFDEADITDLEAFRVETNKEHEKDGVKTTILAFLIKASAAVLKEFPEFNSSLDGENLILKQYFHIGFAADTPNGLVVPVIRDVDKKSVLEIARETSVLAKKARDGKLSPAEMTGGCFSISSLGGIGGTMFTPIINAPEVAILGVSKSEYKPKWDGKQFQPRLMLPMSLSYDHRVVDGASAARFIVQFGKMLADMRRAVL